MARNKGHTGSHQVAAHAAEWLDGKLFPILGPPPLGPYDAETPRTPEHNLCPLCGKPMPQHTVEREGGHAFIHCPGPGMTEMAESGRVA